MPVKESPSGALRLKVFMCSSWISVTAEAGETAAAKRKNRRRQKNKGLLATSEPPANKSQHKDHYNQLN